MIEYEIKSFFKTLTRLLMFVFVTWGWSILNPSLHKYFVFSYWILAIYLLYKTSGWVWKIMTSTFKMLFRENL